MLELEIRAPVAMEIRAGYKSALDIGAGYKSA